MEDMKKVTRAAKVTETVRNIVIHSFLGIWGILVLFPFYWMLLTSVKSYSAYNAEYMPKFYEKCLNS